MTAEDLAVLLNARRWLRHVYLERIEMDGIMEEQVFQTVQDLDGVIARAQGETQLSRAERIPPHDRMYMDSPAGTVVVYDAKGGYEEEKKSADTFLRRGNHYVVSRTEVGNSSSRVYLKEHPGIPFNTVLFGFVEPRLTKG